MQGHLTHQPLADAPTSALGIDIEPLQHQKWPQRMHERDFGVDRTSGEGPRAGACDVSAKLGALTEATAKQLRFIQAEVLTTFKADDRTHEPKQLRHVALVHRPYLDCGGRSGAGPRGLRHV